MDRTLYRGTVRDGAAELARDARMLALHEQGVPNTVIAQRMGVTVSSVRLRIRRARHQRDGVIFPIADGSGAEGDGVA